MRELDVLRAADGPSGSASETPSAAQLLPCPFCGGQARSMPNGWTGCPNWDCRPFRSPETWNRRAPREADANTYPPHITEVP